MAQILQTTEKGLADALVTVLDYAALECWVTRRKRSIRHVPGRMLYVVNVKERDLKQARKIKEEHRIQRGEPL